MITLDAVLALRQPESSHDWATVSEGALHYDCFLGDVVFVVDGVDFSARWGWVPVLDFALVIAGLVAELEPGAEQVFEFTESDAVIRLRRIDDVVEVTSTYVSATASVPFKALLAATRDFARGLAARIVDDHPGLRRNAAFLTAVRRAGINDVG